ncbi:hypothetical protein VC83_01048 [Pseudogymnoascus destructans]|uniref:Beta-mannosidase-like galactose-binding domain-containing protein n=1 Tax=Pseudogymnoascus destructans TaxID=655981 RepID=A0A177AKC6_9PEZI|nr:uncharacterized protein VC83_01048 [Pseudogymnoascus destructans]OAF62539.1 hypothetical protein VC83_01048 [Pseudogymnoascus destructans]
MGSRVPGKIEARYSAAPNSKTREFHVDRKWDMYSRLVTLAGTWLSLLSSPVVPSGTTLSAWAVVPNRGLRSSSIGKQDPAGKELTAALSTGWEFKLAEESQPNSWLPVAKVPTVVHLDLLDNEKTLDPSLDIRKVMDIPMQVYRSNVEGTKTVLVFEGLDTFATVRLNDTEILKSKNMFIPYHVDVTAMIALIASTPSKSTLSLNVRQPIM